MFAKSTTSAGYVRRLVDLLNECSIDAIITYDHLSEGVGVDVRREFRHLLQRARTVFNREVGGYFAPVRGVGLRRLPDREGEAVGDQYLLRSRRAAGNGVRVLGNMIRKSNSMTDTERLATYRKQTHLGLVHQMTLAKHAPPPFTTTAAPNPGEAAKEAFERMRDALGRTKE